jgi:sigma-E factor negative regulatory protein RseA
MMVLENPAMNEKHGELYSALLDGEVSDSQTLQAADRLAAEDAASLDKMARYRLIGDVMRGEASFGGSGVMRDVRERLQAEPTVLAPPRRSVNWLRPVAGVAVAASVAAAAVFVAPQLLNTPSENALNPVSGLAQQAPAPGAPVTFVSSARQTPASILSEGRWQTLDGELHERLNRLVIEHQEFAGRSGVNGPVSHIGLVSYDRR